MLAFVPHHPLHEFEKKIKSKWILNRGLKACLRSTNEKKKSGKLVNHHDLNPKTRRRTPYLRKRLQPTHLSHGSDRGPVFGGESVVGLSVGVLG